MPRSIVCFALGLLSFVAADVLAQPIDGFAEPYRVIDVAAAEIGTIDQLAVVEGQQVKAGQLVARLDDAVLKAALEMANEAMHAQGRLKSAMAEMRLQKDSYNRLIGLRERGHASQIELDRASTQLEVAAARYRTVGEELRLKSIEHQRIKAQLEQRRVVSPIDGVVTSISKDQGEFVSPNDPVVAEIVQLDPLLVVFSVPREFARELKKDQTVPVEFMIPDIEDPREFIERKVEAVVEFVSPTADPQSGTTKVKVRVANSDGELQSGDACRLTVFDKPDESTVADDKTPRSKQRKRKPSGTTRTISFGR